MGRATSDGKHMSVKMMRCLRMAIDPGPHTGIAVREFDGSAVTYMTEDRNELWRLIQLYNPQHLACETFYTGGRVDIHMIRTIEVVGGVKAACAVLGIAYHMQEPQMRKSFLDEAKVMGKRSWEHEYDALAHLLCLEYRLISGEAEAHGDRF